jgi:putative membrane protein
MKSALFCAAAVAALTLAACNQQDVKDPGQSPPVNAAQDVAATAVGAVAGPGAALNTNDYVAHAAQSDMYEIQAAEIAANKAQRADVKTFAQMMIKDHTASTAKIKAAAAGGGITVTPPAQLDERLKGMIDNLNAASAADFDGAYLHQQLAAHTEALAMHKAYGATGDNAALKAAANEIVPVVQHHLSEVTRIGGDLLKDVAPGGQTPQGGSTTPAH